MKLNYFIIKLLGNFEQSDEIYNAMDSGDALEMVTAAERAISIFKFKKVFGIINKKSLSKSRELRFQGNSNYTLRKNRAALVAFNKAIAYAYPSTLEMLHAVSNRSAVLFNMQSVTCLKDISICLNMGSPPDLSRKLNKRMTEAESLVHFEVLRDMNFKHQFLTKFLETEFVRRKDVTRASSDVAFITNDGVRQITAKKKISPGRIVAIEPAFVTCNSNGYDYLSCYYCNKLLLNPSPCNKCIYAMFCTEECQTLCMRDYHSIECQIIDLIENIYCDSKNALTIRAAIKLSLKLGWDKFIAASENMGSSRMKDASTREAYSFNEPLSMLSYDDSQDLLEGRMFNGSVICAIVLRYLNDVPNYFPKEAVKRAAAKKAMLKIMFHLYVHCTNTVYFTNSAYEDKSDTYRTSMQSCMGWFSMSSKLKHSCQPNLLVVGLNDHIALFSLRTIEKGEELTISFIEHYLDFDVSRISTTNIRAPYLFTRTKKMCSCNVCTEGWSCSDLKYEPMTEKQDDLYRKFKSVNDIDVCVDKNCFQLVCEMLETFSAKSRQYHEAYGTLKRFLCICQCKLLDNRGYSKDRVDRVTCGEKQAAP